MSGQHFTLMFTLCLLFGVKNAPRGRRGAAQAGSYGNARNTILPM